MRYSNETRLAAVVLARHIGTEAAAEVMGLDPETLKRWQDQWASQTFIISDRMLEVLAGHIIDALGRLVPALGQADLSQVRLTDLAITIGILVDKLAVLAVTSERLRQANASPQEDVVTAIKRRLGITTTYEHVHPTPPDTANATTITPTTPDTPTTSSTPGRTAKRL
ncbi:MAG: hypothetical protein RMN24_00690 [Anaerolineae bacterium]|nr:hypothetical protein [Anaerolineae bacterium]